MFPLPLGEGQGEGQGDQKIFENLSMLLAS